MRAEGEEVFGISPCVTQEHMSNPSVIARRIGWDNGTFVYGEVIVEADHWTGLAILINATEPVDLVACFDVAEMVQRNRAVAERRRNTGE